MKECTRCNAFKPDSEFFFKNKQKGKLHSQCKQCYKDSRKNQEHYERNKDSYKNRAIARKKRLLKENRQNMLDYLQKHPCVDCGESDPVVLEFDHVNRSNKKYSISKMMSSYRWDSILEEISKCEVVCANCHKRRTANQFNWYKRTCA